MLLHEHVENAALRYGSKTAIVFEGTEISYSRLADRCRRVAGSIARIGTDGDRVAIIADNSATFVELLIAVPAARRLLVLLNPRHSAAELADAVARAGARVLVADSRYSDVIEDVASMVSLDRVFWIDAVHGAIGETYDVLLQDDPVSEWPSTDDDADAWLIYTSGTTGRSKGVVLSHRAIGAAAYGFLHAIRPAREMRALMPFSLSHVTAHAVVAVFDAGGTLVIHRRFQAETYMEAIEEFGITVAPIAPAMLAMILEHRDARTYDVGSLEIMFYGSSPIGLPLLKAGMDLFPEVDFVQAYGQTESTGAAVWLDAETHRRGLRSDASLLGLAGVPGPQVGLRIVDPFGEDCPCGMPGEILLRGDQLMSRYWEDPNATRTAVEDGWLHTGDIGVVDAAGYLRVVDRMKDIIISAGENISSVEVERALSGHPDVAETAVVGVPDDVMGEVVCALVVLDEGATVTADEIREFCRGQLSSYKIPRRVYFVDELPRNSTGKILKSRLRDRFADVD